ncbi:stage IV sporulation protein FA [Brevibacillus aydinogluensis]|uniref:M23 family metallopeptidase n=1 Tax=Brevibacillus aydinogluensis TaxID=927786 RepID=UPI0028929926|nr:M23 family metallopeptidase [Brevibacillus aydinogluensis]MDT3414374.1 stage IV sporulation protein FA [Brevibacillus aydinogluensis]
MFDEVDRVKERRRARMERIRSQSRDSLAPFVDDWKDPIDPDDALFPYASPRNSTMPQLPDREQWGIRIFASALLVGLAYLIFQTSVVPLDWKHSAREVMTRDFNFAGVADWYEARFGALPTLLPSLSGKKAVPVDGHSTQTVWKWPASWKVVKPFDHASGKVVLSTGTDGAVTMGEAGWVTFVGEKPGFGTTVVVRLAQGREMWFGNLEKIQVAVNDFLQPGQVVGIPRAVNETARYLYLGARAQEQAIDPLDVISFE